MTKQYYILMIFLSTFVSCAVLDRSYSFKTSSKQWIRHYEPTDFILFDYQNSHRLSFTYFDDSVKYIVYPEICYVEFLWSPLIIPFVPNVFPFVSNKDSPFIVSIKYYDNDFSPDNMMCIINGKKVYPYIIETEHVFSTKIRGKDTIVNFENHSYWDANFLYSELSPYIIPPQWGNFPTIKRENFNSTFRYWYNVKHVDILDVEIHLPKLMEPLYLKRKRGLQYSLDIIAIPSYR
jgi:hypothetical protein